VIDYRAVDFADVVSDVDVALTTLAGDYAERSISVLRDGGVLCQLYYSKRDAEFPEAVARGIRTDFMLVEPDLIGLQGLARLADAGELKVHVSETFPLEDFVKAHEAMEHGSATGKLVITV
jgi:NADPH:quinone reductase-like Zn-dependent oxidoreductase